MCGRFEFPLQMLWCKQGSLHIPVGRPCCGGRQHESATLHRLSTPWVLEGYEILWRWEVYFAVQGSKFAHPMLKQMGVSIQNIVRGHGIKWKPIYDFISVCNTTHVCISHSMRDFWIRNLHLLKHVVFEIWPLYGKVNVQTSKYLKKLLGRLCKMADPCSQAWPTDVEDRPFKVIQVQRSLHKMKVHIWYSNLSANLHPKSLSVGLVSPKNVGDRQTRTHTVRPSRKYDSCEKGQL